MTMYMMMRQKKNVGQEQRVRVGGAELHSECGLGGGAKKIYVGNVGQR